MSCECESYLVKCVEVNPCNTGSYIGITATETGTWTGKIYFNGAVKKFGVEVTEGEEIAILTSLLNENYVHEFKLYDTVNDLVGCYKLHTELTQSVADAPVPPVAAGSWEWVTIAVNGNTVTSVYLTGEISPNIFMGAGGDINWSENGVTHDPNFADGLGELDFTDMGGFVGNISFMYKNLNP